MLFGPEHVKRYVETDGEVGHDWRDGAPTLILTTTGRRSGEPRPTPLIYGRHGDDYLVVASKGGAPEPPAWYLNLTDDPKVHVQVKADRFPPPPPPPPPAPTPKRSRRRRRCGARWPRSGPPTTSTRARPTARSRWWC